MTHRLRSSPLRLALVGLATLAATSATRAGTIAIEADGANSTEQLGDFTGTLDYTFSGLVGTLVVSLTNTTEEANGGFITGFLFNIDGDATASMVDTTHEQFLFADGSGAPYGDYEAGGALRGRFLGGGGPSAGIGYGETGTFTFTVTGADSSELTASSFLEGPDSAFNFLVRFRGIGSGSDKVPATSGGGGVSNVVPLPAPLALGAVGLVATIAGVRRRKLR